MSYNIFLDFLNRDSRKIYGLFANTSSNLHVDLLNEAVNVAVFLCGRFCVMPPLFLADDKLVQKALSRCQEFFWERLIRMPLREENLDAYFEKKQKEYGPFRDMYPTLLNSHSRVLLKKYPQSLILRSSRVGDEIVRDWEEGQDKGGIWKKLVPFIDPREVERIRKIPRSIRENELAVTWPILEKEIGNNIGMDCRLLRHALQNHYFNVYIREFKLRVVTRLPFTRGISFDLESGDLRHDYEAIRDALRSVKLWEIVQSMSAWSLISLRAKHGFWAFRIAFDEIAGKSKLDEELLQAFTLGAKQILPVFKETTVLDKYEVPIKFPYGKDLTAEELDAVDRRLKAISSPAIEAREESQTGDLGKRGIRIPPRRKVGETVAIFAALPMEREILTKFLGLKGDHVQRIFSGELGSTKILVFGPNEMGRVPAAVETMRFLYNCQQEHKPSLIVVAGIAGGFIEQAVDLGHIIIARRVIDLASRKIRTKRRITVPEFRPAIYRTDERLQDYLEYNSEKKSAWLQKVVKEVKWPVGKRPVIHYGDIASVDEVVSSEIWKKRLINAWPKLLGVEMEAGGVCAAAQHFGVPVAVVRGVADHADPAKADTEWRDMAMDTVVHLLKYVEYDLAL